MQIFTALVNAFRLRKVYRDLPIANPALPARADIEPTTYCNFSCPHCPSTLSRSGDAPPRTHLSLGLFTRILHQLPGVYRIKLVGLGEPLLNPKFFDMVRAARQRHIRVQTTTNGSMLDAERRKELLVCGLNVINISIDAAKAETHARMRPGSNLDRISEGVGKLVAERGKRKTPLIRIWHVLQEEAISELPDLVERCVEWGVDALACTAKLTNFGIESLEKFVQVRRVLADDLERVLPKARHCAAAHHLKFTCPDSPPLPQRPEEGRPCRWPWGRTFVTARGEVVPCPYANGPHGLALGDFSCSGGMLLPPSNSGNQQSGSPTISSTFSEIWNGSAMKELRGQIREHRNPPFCRACYPGWQPKG